MKLYINDITLIKLTSYTEVNLNIYQNLSTLHIEIQIQV